MNSIAINSPAKSIIMQLDKEKRHKQTLGFLGNQGFYVYENSRVGDLTDSLNRDLRRIYAMAVVDYDLRVKGLIVTRDLFSMMGRQFGRAILSKKTVAEVAQGYTSFDYRQNIFSLEDSLGHEIQEEEVSYFLLEDENHRYKGIFSSRDLLIYLSNITRNDINMAQTIQRRISQEDSRIHEQHFDLVASTRSAKGVGGDYYSLLKSHEDKWIISVCDVSGKGISASLLTTTIWGMMSIYKFKKGLPKFLYKVNNYIYNTFESEKFITGIFMDFDAATGEALICDMGHSYLFLHRQGKFQKVKVQGNMPIGVAPSETLKVSRIQLQPGDFLFIPTDGLLEQENNEKKLYPAANIGKILNSLGHKPIEEIHNRIKQNFSSFKGDEHLHDDVTYLLLKYDDNPDDEY